MEANSPINYCSISQI
jgi:hypothetical protein